VSAVITASTRHAVEAATARLRDAGIETARVDAEWLLAGHLGIGRASLMARLDRELSPAAASWYEVAVARRRRREPLQQILGWEEFCGLRVTITAEALIPRPETEALVEWALELLPPAGRVTRRIVDVGTGTGAIACAMAAARPDVEVFAVDVSPAAARLALHNVTTLGLAARVKVAVSDLFRGLDRMRAALIVANPPYLPTSTLRLLAPEVVAYEPALALDGGADGLDVIRRLVAEAPARLGPGGALVLETGGGIQVAEVVALMTSAGLMEIATRRDLAGIERFVAGRRKETT
jgi:release factor glutamine methyltransferase